MKSYIKTVLLVYIIKVTCWLINKFSSKIYIPNIVGGGIRNLKDIELILKNGADKIFLNSAAIKNPKLIDDAVKRFGSSLLFLLRQIKLIVIIILHFMIIKENILKKML